MHTSMLTAHKLTISGLFLTYISQNKDKILQCEYYSTYGSDRRNKANIKPCFEKTHYQKMTFQILCKLEKKVLI